MSDERRRRGEEKTRRGEDASSGATAKNVFNSVVRSQNFICSRELHRSRPRRRGRSGLSRRSHRAAAGASSGRMEGVVAREPKRPRSMSSPATAPRRVTQALGADETHEMRALFASWGLPEAFHAGVARSWRCRLVPLAATEADTAPACLGRFNQGDRGGAAAPRDRGDALPRPARSRARGVRRDGANRGVPARAGRRPRRRGVVRG